MEVFNIISFDNETHGYCIKKVTGEKIEVSGVDFFWSEFEKLNEDTESIDVWVNISHFETGLKITDGLSLKDCLIETSRIVRSHQLAISNGRKLVENIGIELPINK